MLLKINSIEEIGRFRKLTHKAEQLSRLSLIFARNGYGKSTICAVLRSASESESKHISARRNLSATGDCRVQMSWAAGRTVSFGNGAWNRRPEKVHVFDQEYVLRNLHVGESVTRDNKRSLLPVVLGEEGVRFSDAILRLDQEQRQIEVAAKIHARIITAACPIIKADQLAAFCSTEIPADLAERTTSAEKRVQLAKQSTSVAEKRALRTITLPSLESIKEVIGRTIESVSKDAERRVQTHIAAHGMGQHGERWIKFGLEHSKGASCSFCGQDTGQSDLVAAYQTYFSVAFAELSAERDKAIASIDGLLNDDALVGLLRQNAEDGNFWSKVCDLPELPPSGADQIGALVAGLKALHEILMKKVAAPLDALELGSSQAEIENCFAGIAAYNATIAACNVAIEAAKLTASTANLLKEEETLEKWRALAKRQSEPVKPAAEAFAEGETRRLIIAEEKKVAQAALTDFAKRTMAARQRQINELLGDFGASFEIVDAKANFKGREPNTDYAISIGGHKIEVGEKSDDAPSFKTALSAGDKSTLALALFITQIRADPGIANAVVVFDDPFSSQDMARQAETAGQIRAIGGLSRQTIVLSHDPRFLHQIKKDVRDLQVRTFQLQCDDTGVGRLSPWSANDELKPLYLRQFEMIRSYARDGVLLPDATVSSVKQAMRPFLEDYLKLRFPGRFVDGEQISAMAKAIKDAGVNDPLHSSADALIALNEYTRPNMHGGADNPNPDELRAQAKKLLRVVTSY